MRVRDADGHRKPYNCCVDWFSLGCVLYEFLCGVSPFRTERARAWCIHTIADKVTIAITTATSSADEFPSRSVALLVQSGCNRVCSCLRCIYCALRAAKLDCCDITSYCSVLSAQVVSQLCATTCALATALANKACSARYEHCCCSCTHVLQCLLALQRTVHLRKKSLRLLCTIALTACTISQCSADSVHKLCATSITSPAQDKRIDKATMEMEPDWPQVQYYTHYI
jgi:serine/threonine protein kinase